MTKNKISDDSHTKPSDGFNPDQLEYIRAALTDEFQEAQENHPTEAELTAFEMRLLPENRSQVIQKHLVYCADCRDLLVEAPLENEEEPPPRYLSPEAKPVASQTPGFWRKLPFIYSLAAVFAVVFFLLGRFSRQPEAGPQPVDSVVIDLYPQSIHRGSQDLSTWQTDTVTALDLFLHQDGGWPQALFQARILDAQDRLYAEIANIKVNNIGALHLYFDTAPPPGSYQVQVYERGKEKQPFIFTFVLTR